MVMTDLSTESKPLLPPNDRYHQPKSDFPTLLRSSSSSSSPQTSSNLACSTSKRLSQRFYDTQGSTSGGSEVECEENRVHLSEKEGVPLPPSSQPLSNSPFLGSSPLNPGHVSNPALNPTPFPLHIISHLPVTKRKRSAADLQSEKRSDMPHSGDNATDNESTVGNDFLNVKASDSNIPILPAPLPSKRSKKTATARSVLIPVEHLPVFSLPPAPPIKNPELFERVFNHCSLFPKEKGVFEEPDDKHAKHYEKLEHVGDSILGMLVTTWLHETKPGLPCGTATKLKAHLVCNTTLSHLSGLYQFPQRLRGEPRLLPVLRAQTDVRAAIMEAYIAALYLSYPIAERFTVALPMIDGWLRELLDPLYNFFYEYMKNDHKQHHAVIGANDDGVVITAEDQAELDKIDKESEGMALLVEMYGTTKSKHVNWEAQRYETSVGVLWRMSCSIDGVEMGAAMRAVKRRAKDAAAWEVAKKLDLA